jgi:hypothetical protein
MSRKFYVASRLQKHLLDNLLLNEIRNGFWAAQRPAGHATSWVAVDVVVAEGNVSRLGADGFELARGYNFSHADLLHKHEDTIIKLSREIIPSITMKAIRKELVELSHITAGRFTDRYGSIAKANRGQDKLAIRRLALKAEGVSRKLDAVSGVTVIRVPVIRVSEDESIS